MPLTIYSESSQQGFYQATLSTKANPIPVGEFHSWLIHIETNDKKIFQPQQFVIQGGMPGHGHGFPVEPKISKYLGNGDYLIEGMKFSMLGEWQIRFGLIGPDGWDTITFNLDIKPFQGEQKKHIQSWTAEQISLLKTLQINSLNKRKEDPSNQYLNNKIAVKTGKKLFHDKQLSKTKQFSCASCHQEQKAFTDGLELAEGSKRLSRNTPSLIGVANNDWFYWDGRRDSLWAQAITPLETQGEMDNNRTNIVHYFLSVQDYKNDYHQITNDLPTDKFLDSIPLNASPYGTKEEKNAWSQLTIDQQRKVNRMYANIGKFIAAYETTLTYQANRFDQFVDALTDRDYEDANKKLDQNEQAGLRLFLDNEKTQCLRCHNGPLFTNHGFHNIGTGSFGNGNIDYGRYYATHSVRYDQFNCLGDYSDAKPEQCTALRFMLQNEISSFMQGAFKVPSLRNLSKTAPYFHDGRYKNLSEVINHYSKETEELSEIQPIHLSEDEANQLKDFLHTLQ